MYPESGNNELLHHLLRCITCPLKFSCSYLRALLAFVNAHYLSSVPLKGSLLPLLITFLSVFILCPANTGIYAQESKAIDASVSGLEFKLTEIFTRLTDATNRWKLKRLATPEGISYQYAHKVREIANEWLNHTKLGGLVRVNQPPLRGFVNILIFKHQHLRRNARQFACNCQYIPGTDTIICDDAFIDRIVLFLDENTESDFTPANIESTTGASKQNENSSSSDISAVENYVEKLHQTFLLEWLIAHELGHLYLQHSAEDIKMSWEIGSGIKIGRGVEREADMFYIAKLQHRYQGQFAAYLGLRRLTKKLYSKLLAEQHPGRKLDDLDKNLTVTLNYHPDRHPPMLRRVIALAQDLVKRYPNVVTDNQLETISARIKDELSPNTMEPTICSTKSISAENDHVLPEEDKELSIQDYINFFNLHLAEGAFEWAAQDIQNLETSAHFVGGTPIQGKNAWIIRMLRAELAFHRDHQIEPLRELLDKLLDSEYADDPILQINAQVLATKIHRPANPEALVEQLELAEKLLGAGVEAGVIDTRSPTMLFRVYLHLWNLTRRLYHTPEFAARLRHKLLELSNNTELQEITVSLFQSELNSDLRFWLEEAERTKGSFAKNRLLETVSALKSLGQQRGWLDQVLRWAIFEIEVLEVREDISKVWLAEMKHQVARRIYQGSIIGIGRIRDAVAMQTESLLLIKTAVQKSDDSKERSKPRELEANILTQLGWFHVLNDNSNGAMAYLLRAEEIRKQWDTDPATCVDDNDTELAHIRHNLAEASLAVGSFEKATRIAESVLKCRTELSDGFNAAQIKKVLGLSLYFGNDPELGRRILIEYKEELTNFLDDNQIHPSLLQATVSGSVVDVNELLGADTVIPNEGRSHLQ